MMRQCDVVIVGGGPAGSSCAWKLIQAGRDVVVIDKAQFPRQKVCAGWITPAVLDELQIDLDDYRQNAVLQPISSFLTGVIGGPEIETRYELPVSYGIRRWEFDNYLLRRTGAELILGQAIRTLREDLGCWVVNEEFRAPILIGAGGHFCPVKRYFASQNWKRSQGCQPPGNGEESESNCNSPIVVAQEVEFELTEVQERHCTVLPERPELYFCLDLKGYGWIFRKGNWLNIGIGRENESHLSSHVTAFVQTLQARGRIPQDIPGSFHGHAYHLRTQLGGTQAPDGVLIIGDAAGLADRQSGEGIRPAIESGLLAAATILETSQQERSTLRTLFSQKMRAQFGEPSTMSELLNYIPAPIKRLAAQWLMRSHWFSRRVLLDQWFLHANIPALRV